ncbi:MAG: restriction endonuclease [Candidatus Xenobiia bacterium LiM19]
MKNFEIRDMLIKKLKETQNKSDSPREFEQALAEAFEFLGFESKVVGGSGDTDVILIANIGENTYKVSVDAKTSKEGKINDNQINWLSLKDHKIKNQADFISVIGFDFAGGNLERRAKETNASLLKTDDIIKVIKAHSLFPFTLTELKNLFTGNGTRSLDITDLLIQNTSKRGLLELFKTVIEEMQSLQDGKLGCFTYQSLVGREKIEEIEIEPQDIQSIIRLLKLPFINALEEDSDKQFIMTLTIKDLANIFYQISQILSPSHYTPNDSGTDTIDSDAETNTDNEEITSQSEKSGSEHNLGLKYFKWQIEKQSVTAWARKDKPYKHHCPIKHFETIMDAIIDIFKNQGSNVIDKDLVFSKLEGRELTPGRVFKGKAEQYKIYMALEILTLECLLTWTGSKRPITYTLNLTSGDIKDAIERIENWFEKKIKKFNS